MAASDFKPVVIGFLCNWCCYAGADLAGVSRFQYPSHLRVIRQMCSGRVDIEFVMRSFLQGADGVFVGGCHLGDCHYNPEGNYDALGNAMIAKRILQHIGIRPERLRIEWVSAGEGTRFAETQNEIHATMMQLGPLGEAEGQPVAFLREALQAVINMVPYIKLVERERFRLPHRSEENYHKMHADPEFAAIFESMVLDKITQSRLMGRLRQAESLAAEDLAAAFALAPTEVMRHLDILAERGMLRLDGRLARLLPVATAA
ncbi:MAG: hydrogenase iron-sulfur subunit [Azonexus sp.]|jgi:coenzyme F420-reducing hydrogenase delta subunit/DNA-binding transcriptional ArsR family regulator|nr:hydrogenase iron-sulfur subunit [Azonexus sp.]